MEGLLSLQEQYCFSLEVERISPTGLLRPQRAWESRSHSDWNKFWEKEKNKQTKKIKPTSRKLNWKINDSGNLHSGISVVEHMSKGEAPVSNAPLRCLGGGQVGGGNATPLCSSSKPEVGRGPGPGPSPGHSPGSRASRPGDAMSSPHCQCGGYKTTPREAACASFAHSFRKPMEKTKKFSILF